MEAFNWITDHLVLQLSSLGIQKDGIKHFFELYGLIHVWDLIRDVYLSPYIMLVVAPLLALFGRIWPAEKGESLSDGHVLMDFLYPLFSLPVRVGVVVTAIPMMQQFLRSVVPFFDTGLVDGQPLVIQGIVAFIAVDFFSYITHFLKHRVQWMWHFHAIHHSQRHLNPFTVYRVHPFETMLTVAIETIPLAIIGGTRPTWVLFVLIDSMWTFYLHSNIRMNLGPLTYVLMNPQGHRYHHAIEPDRIAQNLGERLTIWDWMLGTLHMDFNTYPPTGVHGLEWIEEKSASPLELARAWLAQFIYPFWMIGRQLFAFVNRLRKPQTAWTGGEQRQDEDRLDRIA